ncbi:MAG: hypothetical protein LBR28_00125 [Bacteroidales bacterium]|jgi:hypothetical protein|nr:hypothetical protein [Bacteroidales bacterium]
MTEKHEIIITKLEEFIVKFYKNKAIRGSIYSAIALILFFLILNILEFVGYNSPFIRTILFYIYIFSAIVIVIFLIIVPLLRIYLRQKRLTYKEAASIIGKFFPEIDDKLLNLLELKQQLTLSDNELLQASIEQKTKTLSPVPFVKAIDKTKNKKYAKGLIVVILGFIVLFISFPRLISEPTHRYINHTAYFAKPAPFSFVIQNKNLVAVQQEDFEIVVKIKGDALPAKVNIVIEGQNYIMLQRDKTTFTYIVKQLQRDMQFYFSAAEVISPNYILKVNPKPIIIDIQTDVIYPAYTKLPSETIKTTSNFSVPKGSIIKWFITTRDTKKIIINPVDSVKNHDNFSKIELQADKAGRAKWEMRAMKDFSFVLMSQNDFVKFTDSLMFSVNVINDYYPQIAVIEQRDSILPQSLFFRGQIKDDYGFTKLTFNIIVYENDSDNPRLSHNEILTINKETQTQEFYYSFDISQINLTAGERASYYFEVWDNDEVNGNKSTKSTAFNLTLPTTHELKENLERSSEEIKQQSNKTLDEIKKLKQEIDELQKRLLDKKNLDWQDSKQMNNLVRKQKELRDKVEKISEQIKQNNELEQRFSPQEEEIVAKQKEIEKLFNELLDEDMKKRMDELEKLMQKQLNKDDMKQTLEQMKISNEDLNKALDKDLELYKRLEIEKKTNEIIDKLKDLSKKQNELSEQKQQNSKQQQQLSQEFNEIKNDLDKLQKQSNELTEPETIPRNKQQEDEIQQYQRSAEQNINKGNKKHAADDQKKASEKMQQMADALETATEEQNQEQLAEDIKEVRQILKNLIRLSEKQEDMIGKLKNTSVSDPLYQKIINEQNNIREDMKMISDSLFEMSKRQPQISNIINKELSQVENNLAKAIENLLKFNQSMYASYKNTQAANFQQYAMTSINNLALLLAESLDNMQKQQSQKQSQNKKQKGNPQQSCDNPGSNGNPKSSSPKSMKQMQDALNKEIERLKKELEGQKQQQNGKPKIGEGAKLNEELARAAAQQELIRKMLQNFAEEQKQAGGKAAGDLSDLMKQMEQVEKDIVNKNITQQTINRQQNITTRLLQHEKAEMKREQEERRQSQTGIDQPNNNDGSFEQFESLKKREIELLKQIPPVYSPYYKTKVNNYFTGSIKYNP